MGKKNYLFGALLKESLKGPKADESSQSTSIRCLAKIMFYYLIKRKPSKALHALSNPVNAYEIKCSFPLRITSYYCWI